jgi:hypothetical protein
MTAPARIREADVARVLKVARRMQCRRVVVDLKNQRIEVIMEEEQPALPPEDWPDEDI